MRPQITVITIMTDDVAHLTAFYRDVLGFEPLVESETYTEFKNEGVRFSICARSVMFEQTDGHSSYHTPFRGQALELCFPCDSPEEVAATYERIVLAGATPIKGPSLMTWGHTTAFFADPEGHIHSIYSE